MSQSDESEGYASDLPYGDGSGMRAWAGMGKAFGDSGRVMMEHTQRMMPMARGRPRLAWGLVTLVLLIGCAGGALVYAVSQADAPARAAEAYCAALKARDYSTVYGLLSSTLRAPTSPRQFAAESTLQETVDGPITQCRVVNANGDGSTAFGRGLGLVFGGPSTATVRMTITHTHLGTRAGAATMQRQADGWKVAALADGLLGTPLAPLHVADHFCKALIAGDFKVAYGDLSARQMSLEQNEATFAGQVTLPSGTRYLGCVLDYARYKVTGATATLPLILNIAVTTPSGAPVIPVKGSVTLIAEQGTWKLDGLDLPTSGG